MCVSWLIESHRKALPSPKGRTSSTGFKSLSHHRLQEAVGVLSHMFLKETAEAKNRDFSAHREGAVAL